MSDNLEIDKENETKNNNNNENNHYIGKKKGVSLFIGGETDGCY